ncbi:dienelactone hydrolase family protein [Pelagicoccus mobilis]|uniref:Dienelactone hydrolase family protein n=1 Tax=Pelagicoccus mobilis TaxID=415221 RepID=A0A934RSF0_9BACT|nr:dienelactone hydrolase family protein [Pelagicoccus mobilis]MBK1875516.1 dienelactone hydrolase family protein [Pelagicoccus mobilis]
MSSSEPTLIRRSYKCSATNSERDYFIHLPSGYETDDTREWPLLFFLHGNGERGNGKDELDLVLKNGPVFESWLRHRNLPFIIVSPQLPTFDRGETLPESSREKPPARDPLRKAPYDQFPLPDFEVQRVPQIESDNPEFTENSSKCGLPGGWQLCVSELEHILQTTLDTFRVDMNRLYLTGLSYGGYGTWHWAAHNPSRWAAIAPLCGDGDPANAHRFTNPDLPIWIFHGGRDSVIRPDWIYDTVNALESAGHKDVRLTIHEELGHNIWDRVYSSQDFYDWLLSHTNTPIAASIDLWYGDKQEFGKYGRPQKWINILGNLSPAQEAKRLSCSMNGGVARQITIGSDGHRLARPGDFNIDINVDELSPGENTLRLYSEFRDGSVIEKEVSIFVHQATSIPKELDLDLTQLNSIPEQIQIVDGKWEQTAEGIRSISPFYDRVLALGDLSWKDYEVTAKVIFNSVLQPNAELGHGGADVIHAALATRWPGHDKDQRQPHRKWWPLGATAEFRLTPSWDDCSWRIIGSPVLIKNEASSRNIVPGNAYFLKHRVQTVSDEQSLYQVKCWPANTSEPKDWDLELLKNDDVSQGGALFLAHYADVTLQAVMVRPI